MFYNYLLDVSLRKLPIHNKRLSLIVNRFTDIDCIELISQISQITNNNNQLFDDFLVKKYRFRENSQIDKCNCISEHLIQI